MVITMNYKHILFTIIVFFSINIFSYAFVIQGQATVPVMDGNITKADKEAREQAMLSSLKNYFSRLKANEPNKEIPDVTTEFFKFIRSYKIAERTYHNDSVTYTLLTDVDDVALNDLMYFVKNIVNTAVYNVTGVNITDQLETNISSAFSDYKFNTKYQSEYQANLMENSTEDLRKSAFRKNQAQYFMDMNVVREPAGEGDCIVNLTTKTFSKTKEFQTLSTRSTASAESDEECVNTAFTLSLLKTLGYVRENFIPLPEDEKILNTFNITAQNYDNFALPKRLMEELKTRSFILDYKIISFRGNTLDISIETYVDINVLLKKLQSIEEEYGFSSEQIGGTNISLDFSS